MNKQIYAIQHNITKRIYVGCSQCPKGRIQAHLAALKRHCHSSAEMQKDFDEYGNDFSAFGLEIVPDETIQCDEKINHYLPLLREIAWMDRLNTIKEGYNRQDCRSQTILAKVRK